MTRVGSQHHQKKVGSSIRNIYINLNSGLVLSHVSTCYLQFVFSRFSPCTIKLLKLSINYYLLLFFYLTFKNRASYI